MTWPSLFVHHGLRAALRLVGFALVLVKISVSAAPPAVDSEPAADAVELSAIRDGFETPRTAWNQEQTDATINLQTHDRTSRAAHEGRTSEHFRFSSNQGSGFYFSYALPKVPASETLKTSLFVRANRAGVQLFARVVIPADTDPETKQPSFLLVPGTIYDNVDGWQRLVIEDFMTALERQARVLRVSSKRRVSLEGAFVESLVVNLFTGSGDTEVFLDELSVDPVSAALVAQHSGSGEPVEKAEVAAEPSQAGAKISTRVRLDRNRLKRRGDDGLFHDWLFTGVHAPGVEVASLHNAGFDVLIDEIDADPKRFQEAVSKGMLLMPRLNRQGNDGAMEPEQVVADALRFPLKDSVMAWDLGDRLGLISDADDRQEELKSIRAIISKMRGLPPGVSRLTTGTIDEDLRLYARAPQNLDILGIREQAWGSSHSPIENYHYLRQRRDITVRANAQALYWAMIPTAAPKAVTQGIWGLDAPPPWGTPQVQPEQVRLMTYAALAAGYRGLAYRGDAELTRPGGRMVLLEMSLLNAEIDLCESILANGSDPIPFYYAFPADPPMLPPAGATSATRTITKKPELKPLGALRTAAIATRDRKGMLLMVAEYGDGGQFQPGQLARNDVKITVIAPEGAQAFEISPGRVRLLERERAVGGTRITLPEFDTTAMILVTTDVAIAERIESVVNSIRPRAVQMAIEQAELKLQWVTEINGRLAADGHFLIPDKERKKRETYGGAITNDQADLLNRASENIKTARENAERLDWETAWLEARRASRPLRILMRGLWENALSELELANTPAEEVAKEELIKLGRAKRVGPPRVIPAVGSAPLAAFNTLPQHYLWLDWIKTGRFGRNLVPSGTFDDPDALKSSGWTDDSFSYDGIRAKVTTETNGGKGRRRIVKMKVEPAKKGGIDELPPFFEQPAAAIRSPAVKVRAGQFLRITVHVQRALPTVEGYGGLIIRDTIGGEALQFVSAEPYPILTKVVLYRRAPADGDFSVTLGLAGYGEAFFDEFSVERIEAASSAGTDLAGGTRPKRPAIAPPTAGRSTSEGRTDR